MTNVTTDDTDRPRTPRQGLFEYLLTHHRDLFATLFLLPLSVGYGVYRSLRNRIAFRMNSAPARHEERVRRVIRQIEDWKAQGARQKLCTARSGWKSMSELVPKYKLSHRAIDVGLSDILEVDEARRIVRVEPLVTMGQITETLLARGWTLPVLPELEELTVGGLIMGFGVETSSHKFGLFQHICESLEVVTAEGKRLRCSADENPELFYLLPWSHGTLGFLVAAELKIIPARRYVRLHYQPVYGLENIVAAFEAASRATDRHDFVEGLVYSRDRAVILCGSLIDEAGVDGRVNPIGRWYQPWFYKHAETFLFAGRDGVEYIPLRHYYHRHTRSLFWMMEEIIPSGNRPWFRWLLGWALPPRVELLKRTETETTRNLRERHQTLQDMLVPMAHLGVSIQYFEDHFQLYPLWLSPMAVYDNPLHCGLVHPLRHEDGRVDPLYVDIGAYGVAKKPGFDNRAALGPLEQFVIDHHGYQALYAQTRMSREQFRTMFDHRDYDRLREQLPFCRQAFDEVYDKVSSQARVAPVEIKKLARQRPR